RSRPPVLHRRGPPDLHAGVVAVHRGHGRRVDDSLGERRVPVREGRHLMLAERVENLLSLLAELRVPTIEHLLPGLLDAEIDRLAAAKGVELNAETREWFRLIGGPGPTRPAGMSIMFSPEFEPVSLQTALEIKQSCLMANFGPSGPSDLRLDGIEHFMPL